MRNLLSSALLLLLFCSMAKAETGRVSLDPDSTFLQRDSSCVITVSADSNVRGVKAIQLDIDIDPLVMMTDTARVRLGNMFVDNDSSTFFYGSFNADQGRLTVDIAVLGGTNVVNGPGVILEFPVQRVAFGVSEISISSYRIRDSLNQPIFVTTDTAWIKVCRHVGDVDGDNRIDIGDLTYIINFVLTMSVGPPVPYESGNVDCRDIVDIGDITRLIDYLFISYAPLCSNCL